jgi:hypothetical protein
MRVSVKVAVGALVHIVMVVPSSTAAVSLAEDAGAPLWQAASASAPVSTATSSRPWGVPVRVSVRTVPPVATKGKTRKPVSAQLGPHPGGCQECASSSYPAVFRPDRR